MCYCSIGLNYLISDKCSVKSIEKRICAVDGKNLSSSDIAVASVIKELCLCRDGVFDFGLDAAETSDIIHHLCVT